MTSTYSPPIVGCAGLLEGAHLWRNSIDVHPNIYIQSGSQSWEYQVALYQWNGTAWVFSSQGPVISGTLSAFDGSNLTIGPSSSGAAPLPDTTFTTTVTGYFFPVTTYWYYYNGWHQAIENAAYFTQYTQAFPGGFASSLCEAYQDPDGRY